MAEGQHLGFMDKCATPFETIFFSYLEEIEYIYSLTQEGLNSKDVNYETWYFK